MKHGKDETRTWPTNYGGLVLICSSVNPYSDRELISICGPEQYARILQLLGPKWFNAVKRGSAIAVGRLVECFRADRLTPESIERRSFTKYTGENWLHVYEDVTPIQPFPWRGQLGWKILTPEEKAKIKLL